MDLREYIEKIRQIGELREIDEADWNLEMGTITEIISERDGPALLFDKIKGYPEGYRVLTNFLNNPKHVSASFGLPVDMPSLDLTQALKARFAEMKPIPPEEVSEGPILENIQEGDDIDILSFPVPKWHEDDGGRYLGTGDMIIMRDPIDNWVNVGTYRLQVHDNNTLGSHISPGHQGGLIREHYWAKGESCPVVAVFGIHPLVWINSMLAFPWGTPELDLAGGLMGSPLKVIKGDYTGLPIPCDAEMAIEGECPPPEVMSKKEGPFGEWPGYYASAGRVAPVIKVKRVLYRNNPIIVGAPPLKPPASGVCTYIFRSVNLWQELEDMGIPGIRGVWHLRGGGPRYFTVISIKQRYSGHAKQVATAAMSTPEGAYHGRFVIVVDDDIDPTNEGDVLWAVGTRCDPATAIDIVRDCWSTPLDPLLTPENRKNRNFANSRAILNACRPFHWKEEFPKVNRASEELREHVLKKHKDLFNSIKAN